MTSGKIAFLFIGQTPRPDTMTEMNGYLPGFTIAEYGALDGLEAHTIQEEYRPMHKEDLLITRLRDGTDVQVSEQRLMGRLQQKLEQAAGEGAQLCVLMCTGSFPNLKCAVPILTMDEVFHRRLTLPESVERIGLIVPLEGQREPFAAQYRHLNREVLSAAASPYGDDAHICREAEKLKKLGADCICLDCMGYNSAQAQQVTGATGLPVYTPRREMADQILRFDHQSE